LFSYRLSLLALFECSAFLNTNPLVIISLFKPEWQIDLPIKLAIDVGLAWLKPILSPASLSVWASVSLCPASRRNDTESFKKVSSRDRSAR
jgi:hypothetical protein